MSKADIPARPMTTGKANIVPMVAVASTIAKGDPPEWLVLALANFQDFVGGEVTSEEARGFAQITAQMHDAADKLITWLPAFLAMPTVIKPPNEVHIALEVLPKIKAYLARAMNQPPRKGGPKPNVERQVCAAIVVEAWTLIHGKAQPRSDWLYRACNEYWQVCGHEYRSEGWRRDVEHAINNPQEWVRDVLIRHKTQARL
jgi:hypothetical protein